MNERADGHRVVVVGAGYAGLPATVRLARQVCRHGVRVTLVNAAHTFVERPRLHQVAAGQTVRARPLAEFLAGSGADLVIGAVTAIRPDAHEVVVRVDGGVRAIGYDTLVYALGSMTDADAVPGVVEHAHVLADPARAERLRDDVAAHPDGRIVVCGGGLTGIEVATELAERRPSAQVNLVSEQAPGDWLSARARAHLGRSLDRLGVSVRDGQRVHRVAERELLLADGSRIGFDVCVWAGGFTVPALARESGLAVTDGGRVIVDPMLRSVSHPDVFAIGDAAAAAGRWGEQLAFGCRTGGFMAPYAADAIADLLAGRTPKPFSFRYIHQCVSLGRRDALIQFVDKTDESPRGFVLTGRAAVRYKDSVLASALWAFNHPGPYLPRRRVPVPAARARELTTTAGTC